MSVDAQAQGGDHEGLGDRAALADERLVFAASQTLFENGEDTSGVLSRAHTMSCALGRPMTIVPAWGEISLRVGAQVALTGPAVPWSINMRRVTATLAAAKDFSAGRLSKAEAAHAVAAATKLPASDTLVFALMCGLGASALSIINGALHPTVVVLVGGAAFLGGILRRWMASSLHIDNGLSQLFAAALLGGAAGGAAAQLHLDLDSSSGLAALGPLLVLIPGPAFLGGAFDLLGLRILLGLSRLAYALLCITALSAGVLLGAGLVGGFTPDPQAPTAHLALWQDMICAGIASAAYGVFFSMPWRMLAVPIVMGMLSHGIRWMCLVDLHMATASAAGLACLFVGVVLEPIARRWNLPFAAVGFASVVAQVPGIYLLRMSAGLFELQRLGAAASQSLLTSIASDGATALFCLVTMTLGLVIPKSFYMHFGERRSAPTASTII